MQSPTDPNTPTEAPPGRARTLIASALQTALVVSYPVGVYLAYTWLETRTMALAILATYAVAVAVKFRGSATEIWQVVRQHIGLPILIGVAIATGSQRVLLFLPVVVNLYFLWTFASSLRNGPPMIERFARIIEGELPDFTLPYCRKVTQAWCLFFAANSLAIALLALAAPLAWWALFTGLISYVLMGALFGGEFLLRKLWFRQYDDRFLDRVLSSLFPAEETENGRRSLAYIAARERRAD